MFVLLIFWILAGIMAEEAARTHYKVTNSSLCLRVTKPPPYVSSWWNFGDNVIVNHIGISPLYEKKVDYNRENLNLCIKRLTKADTGTYTVTIQDKAYQQSTERHRVTVQDAVPRPVIGASALQSNASTGSCRFTVNCSIWDHWLSSVCDKDGCYPSQKPFTKVNITISMSKTTVICGGNNRVSANNVSENVVTMCFSKSDPKIKEAVHTDIVPFIICGICIFFLGFIFLIVKMFWKCRNKTSAAHLIQSQQIEEQPQPEPRLSTSSSSASDVAYENIDAINSVQGDDDEGTNGQRARGAAASQSVSVAKAELPTQIYTVYSELQKPQKLKPQHHQQDAEGS